MILDKFVKIKIINNNIKKYSKIFNKKLCIGDIIDINVNDLSKGSNIIINVSCDLCGEILKKSYKEYNNNYNRGNIFTCKKCSQKKRKINNINKYGYEHHFQSDKIKNKIKNTNLEKYGVEHVSNIENVKEKKKEFKQSEISKEKIKNSWKNKNVDEINKINKKRKNTTVSKYNVSNISQIDEVKEKKKQTCLDNYGTEYPINNKYIRKLIEETNLKKYGHINPLSNINIKEKIKETNLKKYGKEYYQQTSEFKEKTKETNLKKYGVENIMLSEDYIKNNTIIGSDKNYIKCLGNKIHSLKCDNNKSHNYEIDYDNYNKRKKNNSKICTKCYPIKENASIKEKEVLNFIKSFYKGEIIENYRDGFEIDIYIPGLNIGFEFNGLYWHSDKFSDRKSVV